ncbi:MAG: hypothetical protein E5W76_17635, partial [Mesorhizobium sp.]
MGASAVLLFAVPASPLAQPWSIIGGNSISALVGVTVAHFVHDPVIASGLAVALASCQMFTPPDVQESGFQPSDKPITVDNVVANSKLAEMAKAQHPRILATYGGEYSDPKLERMVAKVVGSLTVVSANPTQTYRI